MFFISAPAPFIHEQVVRPPIAVVQPLVRPRQAAATWTLKNVPQSVAAAIRGIPMVGSPKTLASMVIAMTRQHGIIGETAQVDVAARTIIFHMDHPKIGGKLKGYMKNDGSEMGLLADQPLLADAARSYGGTANIQIGQPQAGITPIRVGVKNPGLIFNGSASVSSFGPRYAGSDVAAQNVKIAGYGYAGTLGFIEGLPSWTPQQSLGGYYYGVDGTLNKVTPYGIFGISGQYAIFKEGGSAAALDIHGVQGLMGLTYSLPLNSGITYDAGVYTGWQSEQFGHIAMLTGNQSFYALNAGVNSRFATGYKNGFININGQLWAGLVHSSGLLLGSQGNSWQMGQINASLYQSIPYGMAIQVEAGGQYATAQTPEQEYFTLGGPWRGDAYFAGAAATPAGMYGGIRLYAPNIKYQFHGHAFAVRPFMGFNGAEGAPLYGARLETASADIGAKFTLSKHLTGEAGYAKIIDNQGPHAYSGRIFFDVIGHF